MDNNLPHYKPGDSTCKCIFPYIIVRKFSHWVHSMRFHVGLVTNVYTKIITESVKFRRIRIMTRSNRVKVVSPLSSSNSGQSKLVKFIMKELDGAGKRRKKKARTHITHFKIFMSLIIDSNVMTLPLSGSCSCLFIPHTISGSPL